jgi:hypothetical protein
MVALAFAGWLVIAPWVLSGATPAATINTIITGVAVLVFSLPRGKVLEHYGAWDRYIR